MDQQHCRLLEVVREAVADAFVEDIVPCLVGRRAGILIGQHWYDRLLADGVYGGASPCATAGRCSYIFGTKGPAATMDTACSSSMVATDVGVRYLRAGLCETALAGGVNLLLTNTKWPELGLMLSVRGRCRTWDASSDGIALGDGTSVLVWSPDVPTTKAIGCA